MGGASEMGARVVRVAVNGYGVIGKRVADAASLQDDMTLAGVADGPHGPGQGVAGAGSAEPDRDA